MLKTLILSNFLYKQYCPENKEGAEYMLLPLLKSDSKNKIMRGIRKIHLHSCLPMKKIWIFPWECYLEKADTVILTDTGNVYAVAKYIHHKYPKKRIIIWYHNPIARTVKIENHARKYCEIWSFDKEDCEKYDLKFNPQFCMKCGYVFENRVKQDIFFCGTDKGRLSALLRLEDMLHTKALTTKFMIAGYNTNRISYGEMVENICVSKVIIDYNSKGQQGLTLRPIEALIYGKKLITNNQDIMTYDFYCKDNIFILEKDDEKNLYEFCNSPFQKISKKIVDKYTITGWIDNFMS